MNNRERFNAIMHYQPYDRTLICDFGFWNETLPIWHTQGLPEEIQFPARDANHVEFFGMDFGMDSLGWTAGVDVGLKPGFPYEVLEDRGDHELVQQADGVRVLRRKFMGSIPHPESHLLSDRESWEKHYKPRLDPDNPDRLPSDLEARLQAWEAAAEKDPLVISGGSFYGWLRNWMGMENISYALYDDPVWFEEMVTTVADCIIGTVGQALEVAAKLGIQFDGCGMWEDMCYNTGPLMSPRHFEKILVPHYRRLTDLLNRYGVDVVWVDCDGNIEALMPLWLEAGVNCMFPLEIGTWGADPIRYRREYGQDMLILGGFDKHLLQGSKEGIKQEVHRLAPLVEEGGYIGFCDHRVPPDVPLENYIFYLETVREVWAHGIDLKPMQKVDFKK